MYISRMINKGIDIVDASLPEGRFKKSLRSLRAVYYYRYHNPLYVLDKLVARVELLPDGVLFIELKDGTKLYGLVDKIVHPALKYGKPEKLGRIRKYDHFGDFFSTLSDQYEYDVYEKYYRLRKSDTVVDMGANVGVFSVKAAKEVGNTGKVIAIEPERNCLKLLQRNIQENKLENVTVISKGVWSQRTKLNFYSSSSTGYNTFYGETFYKIDDTKKPEEVDVDTLDNILKELSIKRVDFIKMDIEGSEIEAIKGMEETLKGDVKLAMEGHRVGGKPTTRTVVIELKRIGFRIREQGIIYGSKS